MLYAALCSLQCAMLHDLRRALCSVLCAVLHAACAINCIILFLLASEVGWHTEHAS